MDLRPLSLGELIDRSASIWRAHWKPLFKLFVGFQLGGYILVKLWELAAKRWFPVSRGGARLLETLQANPEEALRQLGGSAVIAAALIVINGFASYFVAVAASRYVFPWMVGRTAGLGESLRFAWQRLGTLLGFFGLMVGWTLVVTALLILPGAGLAAGALIGPSTPLKVALLLLGTVLSMAGGGVAVLWFILRFMLAGQVLALEDAGVLGTFRRSNELSSGRVGAGFLGLTKVRLAIVFTVVVAIFLVVSFVFSVPLAIINLIYANPFDPARANLDAVPALLAVPAELLQVIAQTVIAPLIVVFDLVFYADMRVRREGLDLQLKLAEGPAWPLTGTQP